MKLLNKTLIYIFVFIFLLFNNTLLLNAIDIKTNNDNLTIEKINTEDEKEVKNTTIEISKSKNIELEDNTISSMFESKIKNAMSIVTDKIISVAVFIIPIICVFSMMSKILLKCSFSESCEKENSTNANINIKSKITNKNLLNKSNNEENKENIIKNKEMETESFLKNVEEKTEINIEVLVEKTDEKINNLKQNNKKKENELKPKEEFKIKEPLSPLNNKESIYYSKENTKQIYYEKNKEK